MPFVLVLVTSLTMGVLGAVVAYCLTLRGVRKREWEADCKANRAAEVLHRLQDLAIRVASDVGDHKSQVEEINEELTRPSDANPKEIVDAVARLIETNQRIQQKLSTTEEKLRQQAEEVQNHLAHARTDPLTLLPNRRVFEDELSRRAAEFRRQDRPFSLLVAEVDDFKGLRGKYGQAAGDEVLRGVANALRRKMREMDLVARLEGEEFVMILPGTLLPEAGRAGLRAMDAVHEFRLRVARELVPITASFGVAEIQVAETVAQLIERAEKALLAAKQAGRDCVYQSDGESLDQVSVDPSPGADATGGTAARKSSSASEDPLSAIPDLLTRTTFLHLVRTAVYECKRGGPTLSVILLKLSDSEGPEGRGATSAWTLKRIVDLIEETDILALYSPGCFAVLLPGAPLSVSVEVAERLRASLSASEAETQEKTGLLSVGIAEVGPGDDWLSLMRRAEEAVGRAASGGQERVYYHNGSGCQPVSTLLASAGSL